MQNGYNSPDHTEIFNARCCEEENNDRVLVPNVRDFVQIYAFIFLYG